MILSILLVVVGTVLLLIEPLSAVQLIAAGVLIVSGAFNAFARTYLTYVLIHPVTKIVYIGRASDFGEPAKILKRRLSNHAYIKQGFGNAMIDVAGNGVMYYMAIRGREQQLIDYYGGIGHPMVANIRRGVSKRNKTRFVFHQLSNKYFGELYEFTGNK